MKRAGSRQLTLVFADSPTGDGDCLARDESRGKQYPHAGTIVTEEANQMWGTDLTATVTIEEGPVGVLVALDHCKAECVGIHAAKPATRFEALEPLQQVVGEIFGGFAAGVAAGIQLRHDHGSQYMSDDFQAEIRFLGMELSPAFVRQPEGTAAWSGSFAR